MKKITKYTLIGLALALGAGVAACGARHARHAMHNPEFVKERVSARVDHVLDDIDASDQQRSKVHSVKDRIFVGFTRAHAGSQATRQAALAQWRSDQPNAKELHALVDKRTAEYQKAMHAAVDGLIEVHQTLNAEQRAEVATLIEDRFENH